MINACLRVHGIQEKNGCLYRQPFLLLNNALNQNLFHLVLVDSTEQTKKQKKKRS